MEKIATEAKTIHGISAVNSRIRRKNARISSSKAYSPAESKVIIFLMDHRDRQICQKDIEKELGIRAATATQMLQKMESKGLLTRRTSVYDGRKKIIELTSEVMDQMPDFARQISMVEKVANQNIRPRDLDTFYHVLDQMIRNFDEEELKDDTQERLAQEQNTNMRR